MIAWINVAVLILSSLLFLYFYVLSVSPAGMAMVIGNKAYHRCGNFRVVAILFELVTILCYLLYGLYPLPIPLPTRFTVSGYVAFLMGLVLVDFNRWVDGKRNDRCG